MTRVFRNREEAEKAGWVVETEHDPAFAPLIARNPQAPAIEARIATPLELQLAEALEAVEWEGEHHGGVCPYCGNATKKHDRKCKLSLALKAFRGEGERG